MTAPHASANHNIRGEQTENLLSFRIKLRPEERKGASGGGKIRTVRTQVGHGMSSGWVAGPMKSRDTDYLRSTRGSSGKLAASGMCLGPKDPEEHNGRINHGLVRLHEAERKKKKD